MVRLLLLSTLILVSSAVVMKRLDEDNPCEGQTCTAAQLKPYDECAGKKDIDDCSKCLGKAESQCAALKAGNCYCCTFAKNIYVRLKTYLLLSFRDGVAALSLSLFLIFFLKKTSY